MNESRVGEGGARGRPGRAATSARRDDAGDCGKLVENVRLSQGARVGGMRAMPFPRYRESYGTCDTRPMKRPNLERPARSPIYDHRHICLISASRPTVTVRSRMPFTPVQLACKPHLVTSSL